VSAIAGSPQGRRVLVARVTGESGERIQAWRQRHDPRQAERLPPHVTLSYWAPAADALRLDEQVRHAFNRPIEVRLGGVREFDNPDGTFYVEVLDAEALDAARERLYDGRFLAIERRPAWWPWHITCVRYATGRGRDLDALRRSARDLQLDAPWQIRRIEHLQLGSGRYHPLADWDVSDQSRSLPDGR